MKRLTIRALATSDIDRAFLYYLEVVNADTAERFVKEIDEAYEHIRKFWGTGSLRYADITGVPNLRFWTLKKFPYALFYLEQPNSVEVIRVLHQHSDIPAFL